jgi:DNA-binding LacI/PurR family transcriptional regulator
VALTTPSPVVTLLVETSNAFSRELLHGIRDWMRSHGSWAIHLSEQGRGNTPPPWLQNWHGDGIIVRIETRRIADAVRACGVPVVGIATRQSTDPVAVGDERLAAAMHAGVLQRHLPQIHRNFTQGGTQSTKVTIGGATCETPSPCRCGCRQL